jgi:glucose-1-phosphate cytidylyltransferase
MKTIILAGGFGTRINEESVSRPKPMITIGEQPILWHILKGYSKQGFNDFIICLGYKQYMIKEYFANYYLHTSDVTFNIANNDMSVNQSHSDKWKVSLVDTGLNTMTGGRLKRVKEYVDGETFMVTYGDGVSDLDIAALVKFHKSHGKIATISCYNIGQKFGIINIDDSGKVDSFREKVYGDGSLVNIGYMVFESEVFEQIQGDETVLEKDVLEKLAQNGELMAYLHDGFWQCMDTLRDKQNLDKMWDEGQAPWKIW